MNQSVGHPARICRGCWDQMRMPIPIRGPMAVPFRVFGISQSKMNPNICTICERAFRKVQKSQHVSLPVTILFADLRGYTNLSNHIDPVELSAFVSAFQDQCAEAVWAHDGIVNKQMGDGLMAIFNFPIKIERHAAAAVQAAREIQRRCKAPVAAIARRLGDATERTLGVGVGVHTGQVEIGVFSAGRSDFTAIGGTVNLAARLESKAAAGEILVSAECAGSAPELVAGSLIRALELKGIEGPTIAHIITAGA